MAREVDEDVDLIGLNPIRQLIVRKLPGLDLAINQGTALIGTPSRNGEQE
jgi:hypothetical protein